MTQSRIDQLLELLDLDPGDHTLHYMIGLEYLEQGQSLEAATHLEKYLEVEEAKKGDVGACLGQLAEAYCEMGRVEEALQAYRRGIQSAIEHQHADLRNELTEAMQGLQGETG
jgi:cytochrome c-type biogenesis protein CcmH/NrfG